MCTVNVRGLHWWVAIIDLNAHTIQVWDSIVGSGTNAQRLAAREPELQLLRKWLELNRKAYRTNLSKKYLPASKAAVDNFKGAIAAALQQSNGQGGVGVDCGLHVVHNMLAHVCAADGARVVATTHTEQHVRGSRDAVMYFVLTGRFVKEHWPTTHQDL